MIPRRKLGASSGQGAGNPEAHKQVKVCGNASQSYSAICVCAEKVGTGSVLPLLWQCK